MLKKLEKTQQQWSGYSDVIDYWLTIRQDLIIEYSHIAGLDAKNKRALPTSAQLTRFCEILVDYISAGHFKIYETVVTHWKATGFSANKDIDSIYLHIATTTEPLVSFSDKYANFQLTEENAARLDADISRVGEIIEMRFELEDSLMQLIANSLAHPPGA